MTIVKNQFDIEEVENFLNEHENKSADEMLELLAEQLMDSNPEGLKAGMRKDGYDVDNMKIFEGVDDVKAGNDKST